MDRKKKRPNICSIFQYQMRESLRRRWGRQPRYVCVICECVFRTDVLMFFKSLCRVLLTMAIRVSWTGPLPSCRFKGEAAGLHPPPKPHSSFTLFSI